MTEARHWAGAAKLTWAQVSALRAKPGLDVADLREMADQLGVHPSTLRRAYLGRSWPHPKTARLPEEWKPCAVCGTQFPRSLPGGRRRIPAHWAQKQTCGRACADARRRRPEEAGPCGD